ncbi:MAG: hypothetical protein RH917_11695 [Lacipirellulaceae bacterium]
MTNQPSNSDASNETPWEGCPSGLLVTMAHDLTALKRRKQTLRGVTIASVVLLACGALFVRSLPSGHRIGGIVCAECKPNFVAYSAHLEGKLPPEGEPLSPELLEQMRQHLAGCHLCRGKFSEMYPGLLSHKSHDSRDLIAEYSIALQATAFGSTRTDFPDRRWY